MRQHRVSTSSSSRIVPAEESREQRHSRRIASFAADLRLSIAAVVASHPRREDLADSFPGLLFAIATGYGSARRRTDALAAIDAGLSLREASDRLGLPFWLRKLPARAFRAPLSTVPTEPALVGRLVSLIPTSKTACAAWLQRVLVAHHTGRPDLTLWVASTYRAPAPAATSARFLRTLGWAWFAGAPHTRGAELLGARWQATLGMRRAGAEAQLWGERIELDVCLGSGIADSWLSAGRSQGYDVVPLLTADDFLREAKVMDNCLDRYADKLREGGVRVFSLRRDGRTIADLEISTHPQEVGMPTITQLRTARNRPASAELWQVAFSWLGSQPLRKPPAALTLAVSPKERRTRLERIWQPFLDALPPYARRALATAVFPAPQPSRRRSASRSRGALEIPH